MPTLTGTSRPLYRAQLNFKNDLNEAMKPMVQRIQGIVVSYAGPKGTIPLTSQNEVLQKVGDQVQRFFVGPDMRQPFAADGFTPLAPYPELLNRYLAWVTFQAVKPHAVYMRKHLPADVQLWLNSRMMTEFTSNPLASYDPTHQWVDGKGYTLSGRIWQTGVNTRVKVDQYLTDAIRSGKGALDMAKELEQFLLPNRANLRTDKPYGVNASFDAMRLARTEIGRAHSSAALAASRANPYVESQEWKLSPSHPKMDICDQLATLSMSGERLKPAYPIDGDVPIPIQDSHPQCICTSFAGELRPTDDVVNELRAMIGRGDPPPITPIDPWKFVKILLGAWLANLIADEVL